MEKDEFLARCAVLHSKLNDLVDKVETSQMSVREANEIIKEIGKGINAAEKRLKDSRRTR